MKRLVIAFVLSLAAATAHAMPARAYLVVVVDGLRPDSVTLDLMPRLTRLARRGIVFTAHHAALPSVTRVNAASLVTGAYPETHGLLGNTVYDPRVTASKGLGTDRSANLEAIARADGRLLTATSLGEVLKEAGRKLLVIGTGSSGTTLLLDDLSRSPSIHPDFVRPVALEAMVRRTVGSTPRHAIPNDTQNRHAVDAYLKVGLDHVQPDVTLLWLSDPDGTAHARGLGTPVMRKALALVDAEIGRLEDGLAAKGLLDRTNIVVTSDHGFSTHTGSLKLATLLAPFAQRLPDGSPDVVSIGGAIYVRRPDPARVAGIVTALQAHPAVGAVFTRPSPGGGPNGIVPGTLSFEVARWNHARSGDILVMSNWSAGRNAEGVEGETTDSGIAGHGTTSPFDVHNTLIAAGPDFREHATSDVPTATVDLAPTLLHVMGLAPPASMTGRVIVEGLRAGPAPSSLHVDHFTETVRRDDGSYELTAHISAVAGYRYLDFTEVKRGSVQRSDR